MRISDWSSDVCSSDLDKPRGDFARRLFLYRTFLQARRIALAARKYPGERLLVVVGMMHKDDLERILADHRGIKIIQPSDIASDPGLAEITRHKRGEELRSEERRVGKEVVSKFRTRWWAIP